METVFYAALTTVQLDRIERACRWLDSQLEILTGGSGEWWRAVDLTAYDPVIASIMGYLAYPGTVRYLADDAIQGVKVFAIPFQLLEKLYYAEALHRINKEKSYVRDESGQFVVSVEDLPYSRMCGDGGAIRALRDVLRIEHGYTEPVNFVLVD